MKPSRIPKLIPAAAIAATVILIAGLMIPATSHAQSRGGRGGGRADETRSGGAAKAEKEVAGSAGDPLATTVTTTTAGGKIKVEPAKLEYNECLGRKARRAAYKFSLNKGTELLELVELISKMTCKRFIVSETLRAQKVTIISPEKITVEEAYKAFLSSLDVMGLTVVPAGRYLKIVQGNWAIQGPIKTFGDKQKGRTPLTDDVVTQIIQVKNVDVNEMLLVLNKLKSRNGDITAYKPSNSLIITDNGYNIRRMLYLIKELDLESEGEKIWVVRLKYADPDEVNKILSQLFSATGNARPQVRGRPGRQRDDASQVRASKIVSDSASNSLIIVASTGSFNRIASLIKKLDVEEDAATQKVHVYYLENADAEDLSNTLGALTGTSGGRNVRGRRPARRPGGGQQAATLFEGDVKISADKPTNSLVIVATTKDYLNLRGVIQKLDIPRRQVFVEASILEISMDNTKKVGFAYHGGGVAGEGDTESLIFGGVESSDLNSLLVNPLGMMGLAVGVRGAEIQGSGQLLGVGTDIPGFGVMFQALQNNSDVNILSSPHILTTDNEEAEITVGQNLPFQGAMMGGGFGGLAGAAGAAGAAGGAAALSSFLPGVSVQRQDVALKMKITPHVNESEMVRLELEQEVSDIVSQNFNGMGPATSKRSAKTVVVVRDQQTVVIGGLMGNRVRNSVSKVPILGDIPILGYLFKYKKKTTEKTNLLIVLTPYIIRDQTDLRRILKKKMEERREFIERYTSFKYHEITADVDFRHKRGLLAEINRVAGQAEQEAKLLEEARKASEPEDVEPVEMPTGMTVTPVKGKGTRRNPRRQPASEIRHPPRPVIRERPRRIR